MIPSLTLNQSLMKRGNYKLNVRGVCCKLQVPHPQIERKNEGLTSVPLLSRVELAPQAQLRKKFEGQPSIPLLSRAQAHTLVPNSTPICKHMRETLGVLTQCLQKIFLVVGGMLEKKSQFKNQKNFFVVGTKKNAAEAKKKFFCSCTFQDSAAFIETNHRSVDGLSVSAAKKIFCRRNYRHGTMQQIQDSKAAAKFFSLYLQDLVARHLCANLPIIHSTPSSKKFCLIKKFPRLVTIPNSGSVTRIPSVSRNSVAVALWHLSRLTVLYQPREAVRAFSNQIR